MGKLICVVPFVVNGAGVHLSPKNGQWSGAVILFLTASFLNGTRGARGLAREGPGELSPSGEDAGSRRRRLRPSGSF